MKSLFRVLVCMGVAFTGACRRDDISGPPTLRPGRDECAECGMAIHEERSAAAMIVERDGRRDSLVFDDIGCLLDMEGARQGKIVARFVHDHGSGSWIQGDTAVFVATDGSNLHTPMASGIAAYADQTGAAGGQREFGGEVLDFDALAKWRRQQVEQRRRGSGG